jgi:hypothetical protein
MGVITPQYASRNGEHNLVYGHITSKQYSEALLGKSEDAEPLERWWVVRYSERCFRDSGLGPVFGPVRR